VGAVNDTWGTCSGSLGQDVVFKFTTTAAQKTTVKVTPDTAAPTLKPAVYLRKTCGSTAAGDQLACGSNSTAGGTHSVVVNNLPAGTYYVWVDSTSATAPGAFAVEVKLEAPLLPPANDVCGTGGASAPVLTKGTPVTGTTVVATADYGAALSSACYASMGNFNAPGKDVVYSYTPATAGPFTVEVTPTGWDCSLWYTTATCGDQAACVSGSDSGYTGGKETLSITGVAGTTYYFVVDGFSASGTGGDYTILIP